MLQSKRRRKEKEKRLKSESHAGTQGRTTPSLNSISPQCPAFSFSLSFLSVEKNKCEPTNPKQTEREVWEGQEGV
jgi:hypothetical protein